MNGTILEGEFGCCRGSSLYPMVGVNIDVPLTVNFGQAPFLYNACDEEVDEREFQVAHTMMHTDEFLDWDSYLYADEGASNPSSDDEDSDLFLDSEGNHLDSQDEYDADSGEEDVFAFIRRLNTPDMQQHLFLNELRPDVMRAMMGGSDDDTNDHAHAHDDDDEDDDMPSLISDETDADMPALMSDTDEDDRLAWQIPVTEMVD
ncbi:Aste57867_22538 [Aphanomyces stellatus]|uniref:Aste57867_22538 protein n=1 Tax=Aphanomyces stellatus TaxID=120398 RepID=A0A485LM62_9STRA|nr:hypothetical protein As57867_022468 [Aphanomyces stellatus]VFT99198.1 Aste57867_22538 [Aphanomyces stellatus]